MSEKWYYAKEKERFGPVSFEHIKELALSGQLEGQDLVWNKTMSTWVASETIQDLFEDEPPPLPDEPPPLPDINMILPNSTIHPAPTENAYSSNSASIVDNVFEEEEKHLEVITNCTQAIELEPFELDGLT